jgi:hypothetical protein
MSQDEFDQLLAAMPDIAKVVNEFKSEDVQRNAFAALVHAMGVTSFAEHHEDQQVQDKVHSGQPKSGVANTDRVESVSEATNGKRPKKPAAKRAISIAKDLDLRPNGKQAFKDFIAEKDPTGFYERNTAAVYYLEQTLGLSNIGAPYVLAAYRECSWKEAGNLAQSIRDTAAKKGWLDSSDGNKLSTTPSGRNLIVHDLPKPKNPKS